ncbi:MAG: DUF5620 domain-containing protein [Oscillospiraceae bacterium]|nr:DUF5620 domain-containing protein [Oscillospiraceae bacterium]
MATSTFTNRMKAAGIAALMCLSVAATTITLSAPTIEANAISVGEELAVKDVFNGFTADLASSGVKNITLTLKADYTGNFSYGFGIGTSASPYWYEWDGKKWVDTKGGTVEVPGVEVAVTEGKEFTVVIDTSSLDLSYNPKTDQYPGKYEFRNYYSGTGGTVTVVSAVANGTALPTDAPEDTTGATEDTTEARESHQKTSGTTVNKVTDGKWNFVDNGDGTGTLTATLARQIDFESPLTLTAGYDEDYYAKLKAEAEEAGETFSYQEGIDPINSHKFNYSDFGINGSAVGSELGSRTSVTVESLTATIESPNAPFKRFMYGGGLGVVNKSPADTEYAKKLAGIPGKDNAGYWYNDMGEYMNEEDDGSYEWFQSQGVEFGIEPGFGYDLKTPDSQLGEWFTVTWDVPEAVLPYEGNGGISFQYWYGEEDIEDGYQAIEECQLDGAVLTYTESDTFKYTDSQTIDVNKTIAAGDMSGELSLADMGVRDIDDPYAFVFTVSSKAELDKLVYGVGISTGTEDFSMESPEDANWDFVMCDTPSGDIDIVWFVPAGFNVNSEYGNVQFGY